jgi:hypothetical protein
MGANLLFMGEWLIPQVLLTNLLPFFSQPMLAQTMSLPLLRVLHLPLDFFATRRGRLLPTESSSIDLFASSS